MFHVKHFFIPDVISNNDEFFVIFQLVKRFDQFFGLDPNIQNRYTL